MVRGTKKQGSYVPQTPDKQQESTQKYLKEFENSTSDNLTDGVSTTVVEPCCIHAPGTPVRATPKKREKRKMAQKKNKPTENTLQVAQVHEGNHMDSQNSGIKVYHRRDRSHLYNLVYQKMEKNEELITQRKSFYERVKSFISNMDLIQGNRKFSPWKGSVLDSLVGSFLTQNVSDIRSSDAFMSLAAKYQHKNPPVENSINSIVDWDLVRTAEVDEISKVIEKRGMNEKLALRIKNCLDISPEEWGNVNLEWIRDIPPQWAIENLLSLPGIGVKSVECIRLLAFHQKAFPIDTHAGRVAVRLGWFPVQENPEGEAFHLLKKYPRVNTIQKHLWSLLSELNPSMLYELHCHLIAFGKVLCRKEKPNCSACPMRGECKYYASARLANPESERDIEDFVIDLDKLKQNMSKFDNEKNMLLQGGQNITPSTSSESVSSIPVPKFKNGNCVRTEHKVYVLPDSHRLLAGVFEKREANDECPYLLAIWTPENRSNDESEEQTVDGILLMPIRTTMRGKFPLNGTYFQINEVFADYASVVSPIKVPSSLISDLPRTSLYCGSSISTLCKGMNMFEIQECFLGGYVCFRGFDRKTKEPKALSLKFHDSASKVRGKTTNKVNNIKGRAKLRRRCKEQ